MIKLSVIIPTYNRADVLAMTLDSLGKQTVRKDSFEVIIVDDGSNSQQINAIKKNIHDRQFSTRFFRQKHKGPAAARNLGIRKALGEIVLIINDDTVPTRDLISRHLVFHHKHPQENYGLLGLVTWHPDIEVTPFMQWLENGGPYFSFNSIKGRTANWIQFWTCNISLKKRFLLSCGTFDESFPDAAWEDTELGYRLSLSGLILRFDRRALGYHYHPTTIVSIKNKMVANGRSLHIIKRKIPNQFWPPLAKYPRILFILDRLFFLAFFARLTTIFPNFFNRCKKCSWLNNLVLLHYRIEGFWKDNTN